MIPLLSLLDPLLVLGHLLGVGETDSVDSLEGFVVGVSEEVRRRSLGDGESLYLTGVRDVRSEAEVDERSCEIRRGRGKENEREQEKRRLAMRTKGGKLEEAWVDGILSTKLSREVERGVREEGREGREGDATNHIGKRWKKIPREPAPG